MRTALWMTTQDRRVRCSPVPHKCVVGLDRRTQTSRGGQSPSKQQLRRTRLRWIVGEAPVGPQSSGCVSYTSAALPVRKKTYSIEPNTIISNATHQQQERGPHAPSQGQYQIPEGFAIFNLLQKRIVAGWHTASLRNHGAASALPHVEGRPNGEVHKLRRCQSRLQIIPRPRQDKPIVQIRIMQSTWYGTRHVQVPDRRGKIAKEAGQWATLRCSDQMIALQPHVSGPDVDKEELGQLLLIAQSVRARRKTTMSKKSVDMFKIRSIKVFLQILR